MFILYIIYSIIYSHRIKKLKEERYINEQNYLTNLRRKMYKRLSKITHKNINNLNTVYVGDYYKLGNFLLAINKVIFYCEILQCKRILVNKYYSHFIKNKIYDIKYNLTIERSTKSKMKKYAPVFNWPAPYYTILKILPSNRFDVFKEEILRNLPSLSLDINDLYIHIRNGDVYKHPKYGRYYAQPPLCFYKKVLESKNFNKAYIIAQESNYPIIKRLISDYKNVIYKKNSFKKDISILIHAYNIVGSISSFLTCLIKLNDNLKYFWEYDIYHKATKINHLHYSISNFTRKYTIYRMPPSKIYKKKMYIWNRTQEQLDLMINDTCPNDFEIIKPNA